MKEYKEITKKQLIFSKIFWAMFILIYWLAFYELNIICKFGRINNSEIILGVSILFLLILSVILIVMIKRKTFHVKSKFNFVALIGIVIITCFYGGKIYNSAINYNGKLSWFIEDLKNKRNVKFENNNIYEDGFNGIFEDINKKIHMPQKLYVSSSFKLIFNSNGKIISFDTFLYGKDEKGKLRSYLISYDNKKNKNIIVYLNGNVNANYSSDKLLEPLIKTMKVIPLKDTVSKWNEKKYGILYCGKRSFGYNKEGIVNINSKGKTNTNIDLSSEITGYTVSVFVPGKEDKNTKVRYNLEDGLDNIKKEASCKNTNSEEHIKKSNSEENQFYLSNSLGYQLKVVAAVAGSRAYSLESTYNGGTSWNTINEDPFKGKLGVAAGIVFLNDKIGFLCLSHSGGTRAELYRTEDGGKSFNIVSFPKITVTSTDGAKYNPFDFPSMPYKKEESINILIGQGSDGDYNGGAKALYESKDRGVTFKYVKEIN
ncbi:hypothetical protein ACER0A_005415 [Haloimpatiens sp. FM7315]|uniref:hypothetical protein n=1 Tax=Haloimpatiens sp. FM7315 TaxID=3298609 RepID=UPI0035A3AFBE